MRNLSDIDFTKLPYIPNAVDAVIAYFGRNAHGVLRIHCITCCDESPLADKHKIWGDLYISTGDRECAEDTDECDVCRTKLLTLSQMAQAEHDEQQRQWARHARPSVLIEYGVPGAIRCRVY